MRAYGQYTRAPVWTERGNVYPDIGCGPGVYRVRSCASFVAKLSCRSRYTQGLQQVVNGWNSPSDIQRYGIFWYDANENRFLFKVDPLTEKTFWQRVLGLVFLFLYAQLFVEHA